MPSSGLTGLVCHTGSSCPVPSSIIHAVCQPRGLVGSGIQVAAMYKLPPLHPHPHPCQHSPDAPCVTRFDNTDNTLMVMLRNRADQSTHCGRQSAILPTCACACAWARTCHRPIISACACQRPHTAALRHQLASPLVHEAASVGLPDGHQVCV